MDFSRVALDDEMLALLEDIGPVTLTVAQLADSRAFKHLDHPLAAHAEVLSSRLQVAGWEVCELAWLRLVERFLLPKLPVSVTLCAGSHNSAWARFVDGLTDNELALPAVSVPVSGADVARVFASLSSPPPARSNASRRSLLSGSWAALVDREVTVELVVDREPVVGVVLAASPAMLVVAAGETLVVVPCSAVAHVTVAQLTEAEDAALAARL